MAGLDRLPLWPDTVAAFYADRACSIRSDATRTVWGYTYRQLQHRYPSHAIGDFTTDDLVAFVTQRGVDGPRWAAATARNYRVAIQSLFGWATRAERIGLDPAWRLAQLVRIRPLPTRVSHWLTEAQVVALLAVTNADTVTDQRDRTLLMLGLFAGLRTGELHRLRWHDFDLAGRTATIVSKGGKPSTVPLAPQLHEQITRWRVKLIGEAGFRSDGALLPSITLDRTVRPEVALGIEGIRTVVHRRGAMIDVPDLRPHDLRRTFAGILHAKGVPLEDVSFLLRHETLDATRTYLRPNPLRTRGHIDNLVILGTPGSA